MRRQRESARRGDVKVRCRGNAGSEESPSVTLFTVGSEPNHHIGNAQCPECAEEYPEPCRCGGLMHAAGAEEDEDGTTQLTTCCDQCGRSEDQLDER